MEERKFKTNIKCSACVEKVTPHLNKAVGEGHWQVDLQHPQRILTVAGEKNVDEVQLNQALKDAGYNAEPV